MLYISLIKSLPNFQIEIDFLVNKGIVTLFGKTGCGKTTILRCIAGLLKPDKGIIKKDQEIFYFSEANVEKQPQLIRRVSIKKHQAGQNQPVCFQRVFTVTLFQVFYVG